MSELSHDEIEQIVSKTVIKTLEQLFDVDLKDKEDFREFRDDFAYARAWRRAVQRTGRASITVTATILITGFFAIIGLGIKSWFAH